MAEIDLESGRTDRDRARAAWSRTRQAGPKQVDQFSAAYASYLPLANGCRGAREVAPADLAAATSACATRARAGADAARAARLALREWADHLARMDARDRGELSRSRAGQLWNEQMRSAPRTLAGFRKARAALDRAPQCSLPS